MNGKCSAALCTNITNRKKRERYGKRAKVRDEVPPILSNWTRICPGLTPHFIGWTVETLVALVYLVEKGLLV